MYKDFERDLVAHKCFLKEQNCCNFFMPHFMRASPLCNDSKKIMVFFKWLKNSYQHLKILKVIEMKRPRKRNTVQSQQ